VAAPFLLSCLFRRAPREHHQPGARSGDVAGKAVSEKIDLEPEQRPVASLMWYLFTSQSIENKISFILISSGIKPEVL
jgi:hypothetical protein